MAARKIFERVQLGSLELKNRLVRSATWEALGDEQGRIPKELVDIYKELAAGGVGCIITGFTSVSDHDYLFPGMVRLSNDGLIPYHKQLTDAVHAHGCPILVQLALGEFNRRDKRDGIDMSIDQLTADDIGCLRELFVSAAVRAKKAGYDGVQVHVAHGFYLSQFISPEYNHRKDEYGGDWKKRSAIVCEIIEGIKRAEPSLHVSMKINSTDFSPYGLMAEESMEICKRTAEHGVDSIEVSGNGTSVPGIRAGVNEAYFKDFAVALSEAVSVPVILVGGHRSLKNMTGVLNEGRIACLSLSRPLVREPSLPKRWAEGDESPSLCISCNRCYRSRAHRCVFAK